jgi:hypothetical protein
VIAQRPLFAKPLVAHVAFVGPLFVVWQARETQGLLDASAALKCAAPKLICLDHVRTSLMCFLRFDLSLNICSHTPHS